MRALADREMHLRRRVEQLENRRDALLDRMLPTGARAHTSYTASANYANYAC